MSKKLKKEWVNISNFFTKKVFRNTGNLLKINFLCMDMIH